MDLDQHKAAFGTLAENYQKYRKGYDEKLFDFIVSASKNASSLLDIGCGTGKSTEAFAHSFQKVVGVDHDDLMLAEARKSAALKGLSIEYVEAPAESLPFPDASFDVVTAGAAFHWFSTEKALSEIKRVLKPGGHVFVFWIWDKDSNVDTSPDAEIYERHGWQSVPRSLMSETQVQQLFMEAGLKGASVQLIPTESFFTLDERVGLETTGSAFALFSPETKESFVRDIRGDLAKKLGDRQRFVIKEDTKVVWAQK